MIGTRATGRSRSYRYYTCFNRARYDTTTCDFTRLDADSVDTAVLDALAQFYRTRYDLIDQAIADHRQRHDDSSADTRTELAALTAELTKTQQVIDRYLAAFENGSLDAEPLGPRLAELRTKTTQLTNQRDELTDTLDNAPTTPAPDLLTGIADHITDVITGGGHTQNHSIDRNPGHPGEDHRTRPARAHLPHPPTRKRHRGRYRFCGTSPDGNGSCNDPFGGAKGTRTPDPLTASEVRYQLRHSPESCSRSADPSARDEVTHRGRGWANRWGAVAFGVVS